MRSAWGAALALWAATGWARAGELSLVESERAAWEGSSRAQAWRAESRAADERAGARASGLWPRLSLEGSWQRVAEVPRMKLAPMLPEMQLGTQDVWSFGPQASLTLWDSGASYRAWQAAKAMGEAKAREGDALRRELRLKVRLAYFQAQLAVRQAEVVGESAALAERQHQDIVAQAQAGAASTLDRLQAHVEWLNRRRQHRQALADAAQAGRDLLAAMGGDPASPAPVLEPQQRSLQTLAGVRAARLDNRAPQVRAHEAAAEAARQAWWAAAAGHGPRVSVWGSVYEAYPNSLVPEQVLQKAWGVKASLPLFEGFRAWRDAGEQNAARAAALAKADQARQDLARDWAKCRDRLDSLDAQKPDAEEGAKEAAEVAALAYDAYKAGRGTLTDAQAANVRALEANLALMRLNAQTLAELALLQSLSGEEDKP